jgi:hypothetical protein
MNDLFLRYGPICPALALVAGCASPAMQVPTDLGRNAPRLGLEIMMSETYRGEGIQFGDFYVANITHMPAKTTVDNTTGEVEKRQSYTYELHHHGEKWFGECAARLEQKMKGADGTYELRCRLRPLGGPLGDAWYLDLTGGTDAIALAHGELRRFGEQVAIRSVHRADPEEVHNQVGFGFHSDEATLGAVQTDDNQALWIRNGLDRDMKHVVAAGAAGLVLFEYNRRI